jgi:hypothetical protein
MMLFIRKEHVCDHTHDNRPTSRRNAAHDPASDYAFEVESEGTDQNVKIGQSEECLHNWPPTNLFGPQSPKFASYRVRNQEGGHVEASVGYAEGGVDAIHSVRLDGGIEVHADLAECDDG